jgi:5-methylcytosine-specific restriction endonuclease McrA
VAGRVLRAATRDPSAWDLVYCDGPLEVDHVRASGGLGLKSPTVRTNLVVLCMHHHRLKTEFGKTWRPLLLAYLERVEK